MKSRKLLQMYATGGHHVTVLGYPRIERESGIPEKLDQLIFVYLDLFH